MAATAYKTMCNFNMLCQARDGTCDCAKPRFGPEIARPVPIPFSLMQDNSVYSTLFRVILQQNEVIKSIAEQTKLILERMPSISESSNTLNPSSEETATVSSLQQILCGTEIDQPYRIELVSELPNPAYKERSFSVMLQIVDRDGQKIVLPEGLNFKIMLFTMESPPKVMKINTAGDKILKGTIEAQGNSSIFFRKVAVKEVTSHFRNGCFFFVVTTKDSKNIRPLIVENFVVKARKINNEVSLKKKSKFENSSDIQNSDS